MFLGIKNLYLINGKIVFRLHLQRDGKKLYIWKTICKLGEMPEKDLKKIANTLYIEALLKFKDNSTIQQANLITQELTQNQKVESEELLKNSTPLRSRKKFQKITSPDHNQNKISLASIISAFLSWYKETRRPSSYRRHLISSKFILEFFGSDVSIFSINLSQIQNYIIWRKKKNVSPVTINRELRFLATLINKAVEMEWINNHPLYRRPILQKGVEKERIRYLSPEEEQKLLSSIKNPLIKDIVIFALNTGLRKSEILSLTWDEVNLSENYICLPPEKTKNKKLFFLPLNSQARSILENRFIQRSSKTPLVFHRNENQIKCFKTAFNLALKRAGIQDFRFHDLRHTFASRLVQNGVDIYVVKSLLNHTDIKTTQRYAHLNFQTLKAAVDKLTHNSEVIKNY